MASPGKFVDSFLSLIGFGEKATGFNPTLGSKLDAVPGGGFNLYDHQGNLVQNFKTYNEADKFYWDAWSKAAAGPKGSQGMANPPDELLKPPASATGPVGQGTTTVQMADPAQAQAVLGNLQAAQPAAPGFTPSKSFMDELAQSLKVPKKPPGWEPVEGRAPPPLPGGFAAGGDYAIVDKASGKLMDSGLSKNDADYLAADGDYAIVPTSQIPKHAIPGDMVMPAKGKMPAPKKAAPVQGAYSDPDTQSAATFLINKGASAKDVDALAHGDVPWIGSFSDVKTWAEAVGWKPPGGKPAAPKKAEPPPLTNENYEADAVKWYADVAWQGAKTKAEAYKNWSKQATATGMPDKFKDAVFDQIGKGKPAAKPANVEPPGQSQMTPEQGKKWVDTWESQNIKFDMSDKAREKRRKQQGFTTEAFRGGEFFGSSGKRAYLAANPKLAALYNPDVKQLWLNTQDYHLFNAKGKSWSYTKNLAEAEGRKAGAKGVIVHNVGDEPNLSSDKLGPQTTYLVWDLNTIRDPKAKFDPAKKGDAQWAGKGGTMKNLLASGAAVAIPIGIEGITSNRAEAAPLPKVFHVSPNDFEKFGPLAETVGKGETRLTREGTGRDRPMMGPGVYTAESEGVRDHYIRLIKEKTGGKAYVYENKIKAEPEQLVDMDKPIDAQAPAVRDALAKVGVTDLTQLQQAEVDLVQQLDKLGVKGIQFFDARSRAKGEGTRNYVIFDPDTVAIIKKTAMSTLLGAGGAALASGERAEADEQPSFLRELQGAAPAGGSFMDELRSPVSRRFPASDWTARQVEGGPEVEANFERERELAERPGRPLMENIRAAAGRYPQALKDVARENVAAFGEGGPMPEEPPMSGGREAHAGKLISDFFNLLATPAQAVVRAAEGEKDPVGELAAGFLAPLGGAGAIAKGVKGLKTAFTPVPGPPKSDITRFADELFQIRQAGTADRAELMERAKAMPGEFAAPGVQKQVYHALEEGTPLPPSAKSLTDIHIQPMRDELDQLYNVAKGYGLPASAMPLDPNYMHRQAKGHWWAYDEPGSAADPVHGLPPKGLSRTTSSLKETTYKTLEEQGTGRRLVVSETPHGTIQFWDPGKPGKPVDTGVHGPLEEGSIVSIAGKNFDVGRSRTREIEAATPTRYHTNAFVNTADALVRMRAVVRNQKYLEGLKTDPAFQKWSTTNEKLARQQGWKESSLPQLKGTFLHPKLRAAFDDFYRPGVGADEFLSGLRKVNQWATGTIFWNPLPHIENVATHWVVGRGWDWLKPSGYHSMFVDGAKAIKSVVTQDKDYQRLLREGMGGVYGGVANRDFYQGLAKKMGMEIEADPKRWGPVVKALGLNRPADLVGAIYEASRRTLWAANDVFLVQRVKELERQGLSTKEAIREAEKHIPNYRIPTEVMGSRRLSQAMQDPAFTMFNRYHYGVFNSYANMIRDAVKGKTGKERLDAIGNMMMLGLLTWVAYPAVTDGLKKLTGDEWIEKIPRGPSAVPTAIQHAMQGDSGAFNQLISNSVILAPGLKALGEAVTNRDFFTGQPVRDPGTPALGQAAQLAERTAQTLVSPYQLLSRATSEGAHPPGRILRDQLIGARDPTERQQRGKKIGERLQRRQARKRGQRPRGLIERAYQGVSE